MEIVRITDPQIWDRALQALPNPHVLQSWAWGKIKSRHGWTATRLLFQQEGHPVAAASVLQRKVPILPLSIAYIPKGPILDWNDTALVDRVLAELENKAHYQNALFVKIDPDVYYAQDAPQFSLRPACAEETSNRLRGRGWSFSDGQIQFRNTVLLDLDHSEDELLAAMKQKTRYNTRLAMRRGVTIWEGTSTDLSLFYNLYAETSQRDGFIIRPAEYYYDAWGTFMEQGKARLLFAKVEEETVAGLVLLTFGVTTWYMYGASSGRHRKHMPNQLLQWEAIRRAKATGCTLYDLWGAPDKLDESDPMWGVYRFKLGLGGKLARGLGAWDFPISRTGYRLYSALQPGYLGLLQKQREPSAERDDGS